MEFSSFNALPISTELSLKSLITEFQSSFTASGELNNKSWLSFISAIPPATANAPRPAAPMFPYITETPTSKPPIIISVVPSAKVNIAIVLRT